MATFQCDSDSESSFRPQDAGLHADKNEEVPAYLEHYKELKSIIIQHTETALPNIAEMLSTNGYYIGKAQLKCILDNDFADFDGVKIMLGFNVDPNDETNVGSIVFSFQGAFRTQGKSTEGLTSDDPRFREVSEAVYYAGDPISDGPTSLSSFPQK
ncbi:hypothetical protein [Larkinella soli]|uniref:hypothetical protein n=1 Tax=Larkinella soli TaxID=1770527 RepID=UPI000FFC9017|nr:hypothetical protein [Larkinella soli]